MESELIQTLQTINLKEKSISGLIISDENGLEISNYNIDNNLSGYSASIVSRTKKLSQNSNSDVPTIKIETKEKKYFIRKENDVILTIVSEK
eukprot:gene1584-12709_t